MKEVEIPAIFKEAFNDGFKKPEPETEIDRIAGQINREFITRRLRWKDSIYKICG